MITIIKFNKAKRNPKLDISGLEESFKDISGVTYACNVSKGDNLAIRIDGKYSLAGEILPVITNAGYTIQEDRRIVN